MKTVFLLATTSGWSDIMFYSMSTTDIDNVQVPRNKVEWIIFFIIFIIICSFFLLNLFVGVIISTFNREKERIGGNDLLTPSQKEWIETKLIALKAKPIRVLKIPNNSFRKKCFYLSRSKRFNDVIFVCIVLNTLVIMIKWYEQPQSVSLDTEIINYIFTGIFLVEGIIRLLGVGR